MSGDVVVVLVAEQDGMLHRAVARLGELVPRLPPFAVVGGLGVIVRLGQAHRATNDVDTVSDDQATLLEVLVGAGYDRRGESVLLEPDLKLDVMDVSDGDPEYLPFLTHRFAFDTRTGVEIVVEGVGGGSLASAAVEVARPSALLAMKLGIGEDVGRRRDPRKAGSDVFDIVRLLEQYGPDVLADELLSLGDAYLVQGVLRVAEHRLVEDADRTASAVVRSSVQGVQAMPADRIEYLGQTLVAHLRARAT